MTTQNFFKLWSKTEGSPIFYGKSDKSLETVIGIMLNSYKNYVYGISFSMQDYHEILKNKDFKIEAISETEMKPNNGFNKQNTLNLLNSFSLDPKAKGKHIKSVYARYNNHIKYLQYGKQKMENKKKLDGGKKKLQMEKVWRDANDDMVKQKINCECGGHYTYFNKYGHLKTAKHKKYLENKDTK